MGAGRQRQPTVASLQRLPETAFLFRRNGYYGGDLLRATVLIDSHLSDEVRLLVPHASLSLEARVTSLWHPNKPYQANLITPLCLPKAWKALSSSVALLILFEPGGRCNPNPQAG